MERNPFPTFSQAIQALGRTDTERATKLGITTRALQDVRAGLKAGRVAIHARRLVNSPDALRALADDAEQFTRARANHPISRLERGERIEAEVPA